MNILFLVFFEMWARSTGCSSVLPLPATVVVECPFAYRIESADACGDVLQVVSSVYVPHGGVLGRTYVANGDRVCDLPSLDLYVMNATAEQLSSSAAFGLVDVKPDAVRDLCTPSSLR